jgi:hypothetical protein
MRSNLARPLVGFVFAHLNMFIPLDRLRQTKTLIAFEHPKLLHALPPHFGLGRAES